MENFNLSYREIIPDLSNNEKWIEITLNTGASQSTLQDIKVAENAGGYCYNESPDNRTRNRFIYWRSYHDVLELCENSLDYNLNENNIRYKFTDSPVLSVVIIEQSKFVTILVTTVSSLHRLNFTHPDLSKNETGDAKTTSIFHEAIKSEMHKDPTTFYVIPQSSSTHNAIPSAAASCLSSNGEEAYYSLAYQNQLNLFIMNCRNGHTLTHTLKEHYIMPRIFSNIRGALRGKQSTSDIEYATSLVFSSIRGQTFLLALYRDDNIKMWSTSTTQCVYTLNCVRDNSELRLQGPQTNSLRKINNTDLCVFLSHSNGSEFVCIKISPDTNSSYIMARTKVIPAPQSDLADFEISENRIWALWCNAQGEFSISNFSLIPGTGVNWVSAALEPPPDRYSVSMENGIDARQAYCSYIFHPGKFDKAVISKALVMFRRSNALYDPNVTMHILKDRVCQAIETEIQNETKDFDVSDDEYIEITQRYWERFYSCCEQYHMKACQPVGLVLLKEIDAVCVVKKNTISLLRPCETLEHLMLSGENVDIDNVILTYFDETNKDSGEDLVHLVTILAQLDQWLPEDVKIEFDKKLYQLEMPNVVISNLVDEILAAECNREILPRNFMVHIRQSLQSINDICEAMSMLLNTLRMDHGNPEAMQTHERVTENSRYLFSIGNLFGSVMGISLLSETVRQISLIRYALCRNLLILQQILIDSFSFSCQIIEVIRSKFMPETVVFVQSYYVMVWICETPVNLALSSPDNSIQRLNLLQLTEIRPNLGVQIKSAPLIQIFLNSKGLYTALSLFCDGPYKKIENPLWQFTLIPIATIVNQLIWAVSGNFVFGEWLFSTCQHIIIQEYVRLLNSWCEWNNCSRQFVLAVSLLDNGETHKAYDLFLQSARGIHSEQFLIDRILKSTSSDNLLTSNEELIKYYLKVIQLFEQHRALDHIISLAQVAIGILDQNDPQLPMFQSIIFNNHLTLEHYEEAYHSLILNAELSRRKDCLRQLVLCLFTKKRLDLLIHFPYIGLQDEFEQIVESRARSMSIENNELYSCLFSFYITKGNMRKASSCMYEQAMRLQLESESPTSIQKRYDSLLTCINTLYLVDDRYQWIVKPLINDENEIESTNIDSNNLEVKSLQSKIIVLEISDLRKELLQTDAYLTLANHRREFGASFSNLGIKELIHILSSSGLYTAALKLSASFNIGIEQVFESLSGACVRASDEGPNEPWHWLQENDLANLPHKNNASDMAWTLLQKLIFEHELKNSTSIRKVVVNKLLNLNAFIPQWIYNSYKKDNCAELLRLYVKHGRYLEGSDLAKELIWAILGRGNEYFNIKFPIASTTPEMCLPIRSIDLLLEGLKYNFSTDDLYKQAHLELEELLENYINTALRVSEDKVRLANEMATARLKI